MSEQMPMGNENEKALDDDKPTAEIVLSPEENNIKNRMGEIHEERKNLTLRLEAISPESSQRIPAVHENTEIENLNKQIAELNTEMESLNRQLEEQHEKAA